jgi:hypothetical protein
MVSSQLHRSEAIGQLDLSELALRIAKQSLKGCDGAAAESYVTAIVELELGTTAISNPNFGTFAQGHVVGGGSPSGLRIGTPSDATANERKPGHANGAARLGSDGRFGGVGGRIARDRGNLVASLSRSGCAAFADPIAAILTKCRRRQSDSKNDRHCRKRHSAPKTSSIHNSLFQPPLNLN